MKITTIHCKLKTNKPLKKLQTHYLRGYILNKYNEDNNIELHNHSGTGFVYSYPKIQYKIIRGNAHLLGFNEGMNILKQIILDISELELNHEVYKVVDGYISVRSEDFGISNKIKEYKFIAPWVALNNKNYKDYLKLNEEDRKEKLSKILTGNLISLSKSLNYTVEERINTEILKYKEIPIKYKGNKLVGFYATFNTNFNIPNLFGVGGKVSKGFGTIKLIE